MSRLPVVTFFIMAASAAAALATAGIAAARAQQIAIQPMTQVDTTSATGYFAEPYPIHAAPRWTTAAIPQSFSGTTKEILSCPSSIQADCCTATPITVSVGPSLVQQAQEQGSTLTSFENNNIYRDHTGAWQMATTAYVKNPAYADAGPWNVILHAHPASPSPYAVPTEWIADTLLIGSFAQPVRANYDGKYFADSGNLYLLYSKRLSNQPARDGIVAQLMRSATQPASVAPTVLLKPDDADGGYNSEYFNGLNPPNQFKLIETGNVSVVDGKYAMAYSTGAYNQPGYKAGVAWSDTFLPDAGSFYKKLLKRDTADVWGQPNHLEVQYLLQAQDSNWPNYVAAQVLAPGVPSIVKDGSGHWFLYFAGYAPSDTPTIPATGNFDPSHRRPFFVQLQITIPTDATVATTSATELTNWIAPVTR